MSNSLWPHGMPTRCLCPRDSPGKNTGEGCHAFFQGIFPTQGSNPGLLHCWQILYHLSHQRSPNSGKHKLKCAQKQLLMNEEVKWSEIAQSCPPLCDPVDGSLPVAYQVAYQSMGLSRQECWSGLPFSSPGDLPDPGIEPGSPALQIDALPSEPPGKPHQWGKIYLSLEKFQGFKDLCAFYWGKDLTHFL